MPIAVPRCHDEGMTLPAWHRAPETRFVSAARNDLCEAAYRADSQRGRGVDHG